MVYDKITSLKFDHLFISISRDDDGNVQEISFDDEEDVIVMKPKTAREVIDVLQNILRPTE